MSKHSEIPEERGEGQECKSAEIRERHRRRMRQEGTKTGGKEDNVDRKDQGNERRGRRGKKWRARQREIEWARRESERNRRRDGTFSGMLRGGERDEGAVESP